MDQVAVAQVHDVRAEFTGHHARRVPGRRHGLSGLDVRPVGLAPLGVEEMKQATLNEFVIDTKTLNDETKKLKLQEERYIKAYGLGILPLEQFQKIILPLRNKIMMQSKQALELQDTKSKDSDIVPPNENEINDFVKHTGNVITGLDFLAKKKIVNNIINRVVGNRERLSVSGAIPLSLNLDYVALCTNGRNTQDTTPHTPYLSNEPAKVIPFEFEINLN